LLRLYVKDA